jgi:putative tricarboxylic transport membrane protein
MLETALRQSLILSKGNFSVFVLRPISAVCLAIAIILLLSPLLPILKRKRSLIVQEGSEG